MTLWIERLCSTLSKSCCYRIYEAGTIGRIEIAVDNRFSATEGRERTRRVVKPECDHANVSN